MDLTTPILISSGFATEEEISFMITELKKLADTPETKIGFFYLRQIAVKQLDAGASLGQLYQIVSCPKHV